MFLILKWLLIALIALPLLLLAAGRLGWLSGAAPNDLGVRNGRLKPPSNTPNSVTSQADLYPEHPMLRRARIAPLALRGDGAATLAAIQAIVEKTEGAVIVKSEPDYLYARCTTPLLQFVDDLEFWFDAQAQFVQVRSASRIGYGDRGANRARVESIRQQLASR
jgi:uncharacterized protein (DUF1499 family)